MFSLYQQKTYLHLDILGMACLAILPTPSGRNSNYIAYIAVLLM